MSERLRSLLSEEAAAAERLEGARREAQALKASIPQALKELEEKYGSALSAAEQRQIQELEAEIETFRNRVREKTQEMEEALTLRARDLPRAAEELLRNAILKED